jgi:exopolyphosphatase/guanosine-5'-triphosphate,3'-diphosphate pyrophosphatase
LWASAILHNCGHFISHSAHHKHSYYLIRNSDLLGYTEVEVETIANLARYHRKSDPKKKHDTYRSISSKLYRRAVEQLHPLLRLAVAMDRRQIGAIAKVHVNFRPALQQVDLHLKPTDAEDDCALELWSLGYQKSSFEKAFKVKLVIELASRKSVNGKLGN